jgi:5-methylcytosine-specific restriction endonuclease McrA
LRIIHPFRLWYLVTQLKRKPRMATYKSKVNGRFRKRLGARYVEDVDRRELYETYGGICAICEEPLKFREMTIDHIIPLSAGGEHSYANTQPTHGLCNHIKDSYPMESVDIEEIRRIRVMRRMKKGKQPYFNLTGARGCQARA